LSSGSGKPPASPPELADWQFEALDAVKRSPLARELVFGGGAALAAAYLHHRLSADLDFFSMREIEPAELRPVIRSLTRKGTAVEQRSIGPRRSLVLLHEENEFGRIDFAYYPYDPIDRRPRWHGLQLESLIDMTVNKVQAVLTRFQARDFVDLYFLLREGPEKDLERLLDFVRAKFDVGADRLALAERFLMARDITELPRMLRPVEIAELVAFFDEQARVLVRKG
jgi:predicted nucleotidyltransferase component of viral defense system